MGPEVPRQKLQVVRMLGPSGRARRGLLKVAMREPAGKGRVALRLRPRPVGDGDMLVPWGGEGGILVVCLFSLLGPEWWKVLTL